MATIYVDDSATGADDGTSWTDAYPVLADGLAAATQGDTVLVAAGTYAGGVTVPAGVTLEGAGWLVTVVTTSAETASITLASQTTCRGVKAINTRTASTTSVWGISCSSTTGVTIEDCWIQGGLDGLYASNAFHLTVRRCWMQSKYDAVACAGVGNMLCEHSTMVTVCQDIDASAASHRSSAVYINSTAGLGGTTTHRFVNCTLQVDKTQAAAYEASCLHAPGSHVVLDGCKLLMEQSDAEDTGNLYGVADSATYPSAIRATNCDFYVSNAGSGTTEQVKLNHADSVCDLFSATSNETLSSGAGISVLGPTTVAVNSAVEAGQVGTDAAAVASRLTEARAATLDNDVTAADVDNSRTFFVGEDGYRSRNIVTANTWSSGTRTFGCDFSAALDDPATTLAGVTSVAVTGPVTTSELRLHVSKRKVLFDVAAIAAAATKTVTVTVTTADSQTLVVTGTLEVV
jgi:hypothetical protein